MTQIATQPIEESAVMPNSPMHHEEPTIPIDLNVRTDDFYPPKKLTEITYQRLSILLSIENLQRLREPYEDDENIPAAIASEITRQTHELKRLPTDEIAHKTLEKLNKKLHDVLNPPENPTATKEADEENDDDLDDFIENEYDELTEKEFDENGVEQSLAQTAKGKTQSVVRKPVDLSDLDQLQVDVLQWGIKQSCLFLERNQLTQSLLEAGARCLQQEKHYCIFDAFKINPQILYGLTTYHQTLDSFANACKTKSDGLNQLLQQIATPKSKKKLSDEELAIQGEIKRLDDLQRAIRTEIKDITREMLNEFWRIYAEAAVILADQKISPEDEPYIRSFLRYGMIGQAHWLLSKEVSMFLLDQCDHAKRNLDHHLQATHVLYTDEYIHMVSQGMITPAIDEELELNEKGSDAWKVDKIWRRIVYGKIIESSLNQTLENLRSQTQTSKADLEELETKIGKLNPKKSTFKQKQLEMQEQIQNSKVAITRLQKNIDHIENKLLPNEQATASSAQARMGKLTPMTPEILARREAKGIRKGCKLCAKLKEPFLPFVLRDKYKPGGVISDRATVTQQIQEIEILDPSLFSDILIPSKKAANRIYLRSSPYIVLTPTLGQMGFSLNPRGGPDVGRLFIPVLNTRPGMLARMCYNIFSDFRYDTSKQSAGVDLLTSDTLVAAYANARWVYRKKSKEIRKKAAIHNDENDRNNWRRHYILYMTSAMDGGKKLFFKCPEAYEAVIKYMQLPEGVERL